MKHGLGKIMGVVCVMLFALPHLVIAQHNNLTTKDFSIRDFYFIEPGPTVQSTLYYDGSVIELQTEAVTWPMINSDMSGVTPDQFKKMMLDARAAFDKNPNKIIVSGEGPTRGLNIIFSCDGSVPANAVTALESVAVYIESVFSDPITVSINVNFQSLGPGIIGGTTSYYASAVPWSTTRTGLQSGMDFDDTIQDSLPSGSYIPVRYTYNSGTVTNEGYCYFTKANYRATIGTVSGIAGATTYNSDFSFDYDPNNGISGGTICFQSVAVHETGHVLGFTCHAEFYQSGIEALDIYRFQRSDGGGDYNPDNLSEFRTLARMVDKDDAGSYSNDVNSDLISVEYQMSDGTPYQCSHFGQGQVYAIMQPAFSYGQTFHPDFYKTPDKNMFDAIGWDYPLADVTPPTPNPMTWLTLPYAVSSSEIGMTATLATDNTLPVQYYIEATAGGHNRDWSTDRTYTDAGLNPNTQYGYRVKARDGATPPNDGSYSSYAYKYTLANVPSAPTLSNVTATTMGLDVNPNGNPSATVFAIQCASTTDPSWTGKYVDASGNPTASAVWQTDALWGTITIQSLKELTQYNFHVKARNGDFIETSFGSQSGAQTLDLLFAILGEIFESDGITPVPDPEVTITNLTTGAKWTATVIDNDYTLVLNVGTSFDVHLNDILRIIGKDSVQWVNVTDDTVTQPKINAGGVTINLTLDEHYRDLNDFPMYLAMSPATEKSGAAVAQMALNYMWWNNTVSDTPLIVFPQSQVYETTQVYSAADPFADVNGVWKALQILRPLPYTQYGYNFNKYSNTDSSIMLKLICEWLDYPIDTYGNYEDGHPLHVPGIIPAYGNYTNWMAVRGIHTDTIAYPLPADLTVYGFWINDPLPGGIGENSYKTITQFLDNYYDPLSTGDEWNGKYVGILEPPESAENCELTIAQSMPRFTAGQINQLQNMGDRSVIAKPIEDWIIKAAIDGVTEELIPYDENFATIFNTVIPGKPFFVEGVSNEDYYAVPFTMFMSVDKIQSKNHGKTIADFDAGMSAEDVIVVILISANDGSFKEASWTKEAVKYLPLSKKEARQIAFEAAQDYGLEVGDINGLKPELIHRSASPYYPEWRVIIGEYAIYISQNGVVTIEEWTESEPGGGVMSDDGSFAYALNTAMPTPFTRSTVISYSIAHQGHVSLNIYDISGRLVKMLVHGEKDAGIYSAEWSGYDNNNQKLAPGVYFAKLSSGEFVSVKKLILIK